MNLTIAMPMAGSSLFFPESVHKFPKPFVEIKGQTMIEVVLNNLKKTRQLKTFLFIINEIDAKRFNMENVLRMLTDFNCSIVTQKAATKGAVCSLLLGYDHLFHNDPVLISNCDQVLDESFDSILNFFIDKQADAGLVCFPSVHPQWSFARVSHDDLVIEVAEKDPISRDAIAGLYYFRKGSDFIDSAFNCIRKDRSYNNLFYTSLTLNEMILKNKRVLAYRIREGQYHSFFSPEKIREFEFLPTLRHD